MIDPANPARGEVSLSIDGHEVILAAELGRLASVSKALDCQSLEDLWGKLTSMEVGAVMAGVGALTVRGDKAGALNALRLRHFKACQEAFIAALSYQMEPAGNGDAAAGAATTIPGASLGAVG